MKLVCDDLNGIYVWVIADEDVSPHFDYEEDAIQWFESQIDVKDD